MLAHGPNHTYHGPHKVLLALLELAERILLVVGALDDLRDVVLADVLEDGLDLLGGGRLLGDVELEGVALRQGVVAGLVHGRARLQVDRDLLEQVGDPGRGRGSRLVEDGDDVERLALRGVSASRAGSVLAGVAWHWGLGTHESKHVGGNWGVLRGRRCVDVEAE